MLHYQQHASHDNDKQHNEITSPHLTSPHLTSPHLTSPHLTSPHLTSPHLTSPHCMLCSAGVTALLEECSSVLTGATELLYEVLFTLAQDDWPQVSSHCQTWLASWLPQHNQAGSAVRDCLLTIQCCSLSFLWFALFLKTGIKGACRPAAETCWCTAPVPASILL